MVLKIIIRKIDYTPEELSRIAAVFIPNSDLFTDKGTETYEASFSGGGLTRIAKCIRIVRAVDGHRSRYQKKVDEFTERIRLT